MKEFLISLLCLCLHTQSYAMNGASTTLVPYQHSYPSIIVRAPIVTTLQAYTSPATPNKPIYTGTVLSSKSVNSIIKKAVANSRILQDIRLKHAELKDGLPVFHAKDAQEQTMRSMLANSLFFISWKILQLNDQFLLLKSEHDEWCAQHAITKETFVLPKDSLLQVHYELLCKAGALAPLMHKYNQLKKYKR